MIGRTLRKWVRFAPQTRRVVVTGKHGRLNRTRQLCRGRKTLFFAVCLTLSGAGVNANCRQAIALGLDVSGSVDAREYRLQLDGLASALSHAEVRAALLANPEIPVDLAVFEWSAPEYQRLLVNWTRVQNADTLTRIVAKLRQTARQSSPPVTGLGQAILYGKTLLDQRQACWKRTLDISGDGRSNSGPNPRDVRKSLGNITLNALVIGADAPHGGDLRQAQIAELSAYFGAVVIYGPDAFVETALGFESYETAMIRKLLRELQGLTVSQMITR